MNKILAIIGRPVRQALEGLRRAIKWSASQGPRILLGLAVILVVWLLCRVLLGYIQTGFNDFTDSNGGFHAGKTLWDWMQLLIIPAVLAVGAWLFTWTNQQTERQIASDRLQESALQSYLDRMSELLLDKNLRKAGIDDETRDVARVRTLTALRGLGPSRKSILLRFLYEAGLVNIDNQVISMDGADLKGIDLGQGGPSTHPFAGAEGRGVYVTGVQLGRINLCGADLSDARLDLANLHHADLHEAALGKATLTLARLTEANLVGADLAEANLNMAVLRDAQLSDANLSDANLSGANLSGANLNGAGLSRAFMIGTNLSGADVSETNLVEAHLQHAKLIGADLSKAFLSSADACHADLSGANLSEAYLVDADLTEANLIGAKVTKEQLAAAKSLAGATMPDGTKHE